MFRFILGKLAYLLPTFIGITIVAFGFVRILPGDPVLLMAGERGLTPERHAELLAKMGYDQPIWQQYLSFLGRLFQGDFGTSIVTKKPVLTEFFTLFPATFELSLCAILLATLIGLPLGVFAAIKRGSWFDQLSMSTALVGYSMPIFWWGLLLIIFFSGVSGLDAGFGTHFADVLFPASDRLHADRQPAFGAERRVWIGAGASDFANHRAGHDPDGGHRPASAVGDA